MDFELASPPVESAPIASPATYGPSQTLRGIDWAGIAAESQGQIALFTVTDPGQLQEWGRRGDNLQETEGKR